MTTATDQVTYRQTQITLLVDSSGSMQPLRDDVVGGINGFLSEQAEDGADCSVSVFGFAGPGSLTVLRDAQPVEAVHPLEADEYRPGGGTALYDAMAAAMARADGSDTQQIFAVYTDGAENASREFGSTHIREMVGARSERGWQFVYLGAHADAFEEAGRAGFSTRRTHQFESGTQGVRGAAQSLSRFCREARSAYREGRPVEGRGALGVGRPEDESDGSPPTPRSADLVYTAPPPRPLRQRVARENRYFFAKGGYTRNDGSWCALEPHLAGACQGTATWTPEALAALPGPPVGGRAGAITIANEATLDSARRLDDGHLMALNFASARRAGGLYYEGSRAQEECMCRESALHPTLETQFDQFYAPNRQAGHRLFTDHMIHSPGVPVFRDAKLTLLEAPYRISFVSAPMPSTGLLDPALLHHVEATVRRRIDLLLRLCQHSGHRRLILGAWGCGANGNDAEMVARLFSEALNDNGWRRAFEHVHFAVLDVALRMGVYPPFERWLAR